MATVVSLMLRCDHGSCIRLLDEARSGWASFTDVKLERNGHQGIVFRTTKPDDERQLRSNNKNVQILSIQKVTYLLCFCERTTVILKSPTTCLSLEWTTFYDSGIEADSGANEGGLGSVFETTGRGGGQGR